MSEIVTKEQYWIDILNDNSKFGQITTEDTSFNLRANDVWKVVENTLLDTEDEEDVANWERITQLDSGELTIFQRKVNILYTLSAKNYVPISIIEKIVEKTAGVAVVIEWDKENDKVIVHTDKADANTVEYTNSIINCVLPKFLELDRYNHTHEISWRDAYKYAYCTNTDDLSAINANYKNDLTSDGEWVHKLPNLTSGERAFISCNSLQKFNVDLPNMTVGSNMFRDCRGIKAFIGDLSNLEYGVLMFLSCPIESFITTNLYKLKDADHMFSTCRSLKRFSYDLPSMTIGQRMFYNCVELTTFSGDLSRLKNGHEMFYSCKLDKNSALNVFATIPSYTDGVSYLLTVGIHIDHQNDEEVLAAIESATAKGWTVTTQWNGTATTSTYSLRPTQSQPIYAKYEADELGMYIDANNVCYSVNWGHMISSPDGKSPEELGYTLFESIEEALTTWGLTEIMEIPEQES